MQNWTPVAARSPPPCGYSKRHGYEQRAQTGIVAADDFHRPLPVLPREKPPPDEKAVPGEYAEHCSRNHLPRGHSKQPDGNRNNRTKTRKKSVRQNHKNTSPATQPFRQRDPWRRTLYPPEARKHATPVCSPEHVKAEKPGGASRHRCPDDRPKIERAATNQVCTENRHRITRYRREQILNHCTEKQDGIRFCGMMRGKLMQPECEFAQTTGSRFEPSSYHGAFR